MRPSLYFDGSLSGWLNQFLSRAFIVLIVAIVILPWASSQAFSAGCRWNEIPVGPIDWNPENSFRSFMAFDKSDGNLALISSGWGSDVQLWKLMDGTWVKVWEGEPDVGPSYNFTGLEYFYYDENLGSLIALASYQVSTPETCEQYLLIKYVPDVGFVLANSFPICPLWGSITVVYDPFKKRELFIGAFQETIQTEFISATVEYDGNEFYIVPYPEGSPEIAFVSGSTGFDPRTRRAVFYGVRWEELTRETWEFDGYSWTLIPTDSAPPMDPWQVIGMIYVPALGGLLAVPDIYSGLLDAWVYKAKQWNKVTIANQFDGRPHGFLVFDASRNAPVFYGGWTESGFSNQMFELQCSGHVRPVFRP